VFGWTSVCVIEVELFLLLHFSFKVNVLNHSLVRLGLPLFLSIFNLQSEHALVVQVALVLRPDLVVHHLAHEVALFVHRARWTNKRSYTVVAP
jgi:hypothetical protein